MGQVVVRKERATQLRSVGTPGICTCFRHAVLFIILFNFIIFDYRIFKYGRFRTLYINPSVFRMATLQSLYC